MLSKTKLLKNIFTDSRLFTILILSMVSGMPMAFFSTMLSAWFKDLGMAVTVIGLFSITKSPYSFKYAWAPVVDHFKLPVLFNTLGRRRSWMLLANIIVVASLLAIGSSNPVENIQLTVVLTCVFGFFAATYDIAFDAFRIESLEENMQAMGVSTTILGYKLGMLSISVGSLLISEQFSWNSTFLYAGTLLSVGTIIILLSKEPKSIITNFKGINVDMFNKTIVEPFSEFYKRDYAIVILSAVTLYKLGEAMLSSMTMPFYMETGFTKTEIAKISKIYGVIATLVGVYIGAAISARVGNLKSLMICGTTQMLSNLMFVWQNHMGADISALMVTLTIENVTGGMGGAALMGYMSALCNRKFTATHYALLSSFASFANNTLAASSGYWVRGLGWDMFFIFTTIISLPALLIIKYLDKKMSQ
jgi:PAT family beta-lactamase induction signal transducer AmpG